MCEGDLPAAVLAGSSESWGKPPALGNELPPVVSELSDPAPDIEREASGSRLCGTPTARRPRRGPGERAADEGCRTIGVFRYFPDQ